MDWDRVARENKYARGSKTKTGETNQKIPQLRYHKAETPGQCSRCRKPYKIKDSVIGFPGRNQPVMHKKCFKKS
jgi:hypothetical protein